MNLWESPQYLIWQVIHIVGSLPTTIVELLILVWALRTHRERPRTAKLMLCFVGLLVVHHFGLPRLWELFYMAVGWVGSAPAMASTAVTLFVFYGLSLAMTMATWAVAILAVFGREEHEEAAPVTNPTATTDAPGGSP